MIVDIVRDAFLSFFVAIGFALLFETPRKALLIAGLLGGVGHCIRFALLQSDYGLVASHFILGCFHRYTSEHACSFNTFSRA